MHFGLVSLFESFLVRLLLNHGDFPVLELSPHSERERNEGIFVTAKVTITATERWVEVTRGYKWVKT